MGDRKLRALIVEDVFLLRRMLERIISPYCDIVSTDNGEAAFEKYSESFFDGMPFDVICLDIYMPRMDGLETLQNIRTFEEEIKLKQEDKVKIIMITSLSNHNNVDKALKLGANNYITKPFAKEDVLATMKKLGLIDGIALRE